MPQQRASTPQYSMGLPVNGGLLGQNGGLPALAGTSTLPYLPPGVSNLPQLPATSAWSNFQQQLASPPVSQRRANGGQSTLPPMAPRPAPAPPAAAPAPYIPTGEPRPYYDIEGNGGYFDENGQWIITDWNRDNGD